MVALAQRALARAYFADKLPHKSGVQQVAVRPVMKDVQAGLDPGDTSEFIRERGRQESKREAGQQHHKIGPEHERRSKAEDRGSADLR